MSTQDVEIKLEEAIKRLLERMHKVECDSAEYAKMADQLVKLYKMRDIDNTYRVRTTELDLKREDYQNIQTFKQGEIELKGQELDIRRQEIELKRDELESRKFDSDKNLELKDNELTLRREEFESSRKISPETWATIGGNLIGIALIIGYERVNVLTSKAVNFVTKLR